jgi:DNA-binding NtrC family response regulator
MKSDTKIIIIDDQIKGNEELLIELDENYGGVITYESSKKAMEELSNYYDQKIIILLDLSFPDKEFSGHTVLEKIRQENKLIPVIIWSAVNENEESFSDLINNSAFGFLKRDASSQEIMAKLAEADAQINSSVSAALEDWISSHPDDLKDTPYMLTINGAEYTLRDILKEVRLQTEIGTKFSNQLTKLTIDLLLRNKENLDG